MSIIKLVTLQTIVAHDFRYDPRTSNTEEHSCKHYILAKTINITHFEDVFVALDIQHAMRMSHIIIC